MLATGDEAACREARDALGEDLPHGCRKKGRKGITGAQTVKGKTACKNEHYKDLSDGIKGENQYFCEQKKEIKRALDAISGS